MIIKKERHIRIVLCRKKEFKKVFKITMFYRYLDFLKYGVKNFVFLSITCCRDKQNTYISTIAK